MMTEGELRKQLQELDAFWAEDNRKRIERGIGGHWPADYYWYAAKRRAFLQVLGEVSNQEKWE